MKAIRVHEHGGTDKVVIDDIPAPGLKPGQVLVRIKATSINHLDIWVRNGMRNVSLPLPMILGSDGAGVVEESGSGIHDLDVGERVLLSPATSCGKCPECAAGRDNYCREYRILGEHCDGTDAEYVATDRANVFRLPDEVSFDAAAASALVFITSYQMLVEKAAIQAGETVLVIGAGSGVGTAAIQIAKLYNASVIAVAGSDEKLAKARALGADEVINHKKERISDAVRRLTGKRGVDIVFEHTGKSTWPESILSAARGGRIVTCGATTGPDAMTDLRYLFSKQLTIYGSMMGRKGLLPILLELLKSGKFRAVIHRKFPFSEVREAQELLESGSHFGKIVLEF